MSEMDERKKELQELIEARKRKNDNPETGGVTGGLDKAEVLVPKTFKEKWINYWYHYKFVTIGIALTIVFLMLIIWPMLFPERFDATLTIVSAFRFEGIQEQLNADLAKIVDDVDENGEKKVELTPFWLASDSDTAMTDPELYAATLQKLAVWPTSNDHFLYLLDKNSYAYLTELGVSFMDLSDQFSGDQVEGDKYFVKGTKLEEVFYLTGSEADYEMFLCFVDYGAFAENVQEKKDIKTAYEHDWAFFEKLIFLK